MILTPVIWARLAAIALVAAILQVTLFAKVTFIGASADVALLVVVSLGLLGGSVSGAVAGFSIGLLIDCLLMQTLGATSLPLLTVGYLAGRYREGFGRVTRGATVLLAAALTLLGVTAFALIQVVTGVGAEVSPLIVRDAILKTVMAVPLALPVHVAVRRLLRPALIEDDAKPYRRLEAAAAGRPEA